MTGISIREFAKREGCAPSLVVKAITKGRLAKLPDGKLDADLVGTGWRETNRRSAAAAPAASGTPNAAVAVPEQGADGEGAALLIHDNMTLAEAERAKEINLARLRKLEFDIKSGAVVPIAVVTAEVSKRYAAIRAKLLGLGATITPRLAPRSQKSAAEIQAEIDIVVRQALEELSSGPGAA